MLGWTGQSLRETTGTIYYTREMKEKGNKNSTALPQLLTAVSYISLGREGCEKVSQAAIHLWWHVYFYLHFLSCNSCIILFATTHVAKVCGACVFVGIFIIWPHLMNDVGRYGNFLDPFAHGFRCWVKSSKHREEFQLYLPWIGEWIASMFMYYTVLH